MNVDALLMSIPPAGVYAVVAVVVGLESLGIPLPGEITLVAAAILASHHELAVAPLWVGLAGAAGAIIGDSIGYEIGHAQGWRLLKAVRRRFPKHVNPETLAFATWTFHRYGPLAVFGGRFVALLRILSGPLSGTLKLPYRVFLPANALGGLVWALGTTYAVYYLGQAAQHALKEAAWAGLAAFVVAALAASTLLRRSMDRRVHAFAATHPDEVRAADEASRA
ncbi:MAG: DedA family protein [Austwickia sp.]|nr:DedA family protein [Actinomycetota bacterium]MCO5311251.1 DedA family protein [Austwickia sp.]